MKALQEIKEALEYYANGADDGDDINTEIAQEALSKLNALIERMESGELSDGYHTFNELYEHRHALFANVINGNKTGWKSKLHDDGTMFDGWFIAGIITRDGDITYHLPVKHWDIFTCRELANAPKWDGHTSNDVISRLQKEAINVIKEL